MPYTDTLPPEIKEVLVHSEEIDSCVTALAIRIEKEYAGKTATFICNLQGAMMFYTRLISDVYDMNMDRIRAVTDLNKPFDAEVYYKNKLSIVQDTISTSKYGSKSHDIREPRIRFDLYHPVRDATILLIEDLIDTSDTMRFILNYLALKSPKSLAVCSLFVKERALQFLDKSQYPYYYGKLIPNEWVVGMGLDGNGQIDARGDVVPGLFRELPYLGVLKPS